MWGKDKKEVNKKLDLILRKATEIGKKIEGINDEMTKLGSLVADLFNKTLSKFFFKNPLDFSNDK